MEALSKDLWVFIETDEEGKARNVGLELLNPGRRLQMPRAVLLWQL